MKFFILKYHDIKTVNKLKPQNGKLQMLFIIYISRVEYTTEGRHHDH